jgi:hypothetical protein
MRKRIRRRIVPTRHSAIAMNTLEMPKANHDTIIKYVHQGWFGICLVDQQSCQDHVITGSCGSSSRFMIVLSETWLLPSIRRPNHYRRFVLPERATIRPLPGLPHARSHEHPAQVDRRIGRDGFDGHHQLPFGTHSRYSSRYAGNSTGFVANLSVLSRRTTQPLRFPAPIRMVG